MKSITAMLTLKPSIKMYGSCPFFTKVVLLNQSTIGFVTNHLCIPNLKKHDFQMRSVQMICHETSTDFAIFYKL